MTGHNNSIYSLVKLPDQRLASASADLTIKIWNSSNGNLLNTFIGHTDWIMSLALLASEENESMIRLASGSFDKTIKIWNVNDGSLLSTLIGHSDRVSSLALLADGNLASGSFDLSINVWNTRTGFQSI